MTRSIIAELAQRLGKTEEEVVQFFQLLWQVMPPLPETQPYFFRYLDERFLRLEDRYTTLREEMHQQIEALRKEVQQGDAALQQQIEALRKEVQQGDAALQQQIEALRKEMQQGDAALQQQIEALRKEMQQGDAALQQQIEALRKEMQQQMETLRGEIKHVEVLLRQEIQALGQHVERLEKWMFALTVPVFVSTLGILGLLIQAFLTR